MHTIDVEEQVEITPPPSSGPADDRLLRRSLDLVVVAACAAFVFWQLHPELILARTTPAGGDMGAHVWAFGYLRDHLLPDLRLTGWSPDWYAGFPVFQFYMVIPFLGMVVLNAGLSGVASILPAAASLALTARARGVRATRSSLRAGGALVPIAAVVGLLGGYGTSFRFVLMGTAVAVAIAVLVSRRSLAPRLFATAAIVVALVGISMPYGPSFKLVSVAGVVAMPVSAYVFGRAARFPYPTPALLSVATLVFLFDTNFTIYGGNIASTMAGEFAFSISLALALAYLAVLSHGLRTGTHRATAAVLLALVGLCHLIPAFFALAATAVLVLVHVVSESAGDHRRRVVADAAAVLALVAVGGAGLLAVVTGVVTIGPMVAVAVAAAVVIGLLWNLTRDPTVRPVTDQPLGRARVWWLLSAGVVAGMLAAWWVLPFFWQRTYLNDMGWEKIAVHREGTAIWDWFTDEVWPALVTGDLRMFAALALVGAVLSVVLRNRTGTALVVLGLGLALAFVYVPQGRLWNARLLPFWYLVVYLLAAVGVGEVVRALSQVVATDPDQPRRAWQWAAAPLLLVVVAVFLGGQLRNLPGGETNPDGSYRLLSSVGVPGVGSIDIPDLLAVDVSGRNFVTDWSRWNYSGYERKDAYGEYRDIVATMDEVGRAEGCGMSLWEYSSDLNDYGTPMALMLLPHWTDGCIGSMEGLYFEASSTTPFHFLMQSELSAAPSRAQRDMPYRDLDIDAGVEHLQLFGVRYYLARSAEATSAAGAHPDLTEIATSGPWVVYDVAEAPTVEPLAYEPAVTTAGEGQHEWLCSGEDEHGRCTGPALDWFQEASRRDVALAASGPQEWQRVEPGTVPDRRPVEPAVVSDVSATDSSISFRVDRPGTPVLVKASYFPNWEVSGADGPYRVAPNLMVVVPTDEDVSLRYGRAPIDWLGIAASLLGLVLLVGLARRPPVAVPRQRPSGPEPGVAVPERVPDSPHDPAAD